MIDGDIWLLLDSRGPGGIETHVAQLAQGLMAAGVAVEVVFLADHGRHPLRDQLASSGIPQRCLSGGVRGVWRALEDERPRLIHTHGYKAGIIGRILGRRAGLPVVSTFHAGEPGSGKVRLYTALDRLTAPLAPAIAVSGPIAARLPGRAAIIPNFVALPPPEAVSSRPDAPVAFVGRLSPEKGPDRFAQLANQVREAQFLCFGDGPLRHETEAQAAGRIEFRGMVASMADHWKEIGVLCVTSRHEGLPLAVLEAMANGVPVAAFDIGALAEVVISGETGWLVPPGDLDAMAAAVRDWRALDDRAREALSRRCRSRIQSTFSVEACLPAILAVYERALRSD